jgi:hypothetical protein
MGAVGPDHIVELLNGRYAVYNKTGFFLGGSSLNSFWINAGVTPSGSFAFDPRVVYDKHSGRWFATSVDNPGSANNFLVAVSNGSNPLLGWTGFKIDSDGDDSHWADFPMLGLNQDVVVIAANMFPLIVGSVNTSYLVLPKSDLLIATPTVANRTLFPNVNPSNTGYSPQPILDLDGNPLPLPVLSSYNKTSGSLKAFNIGGTALAPTLNTTGGLISVTARFTPPPIDQPGSKADIDAGNSRFSGNVVMQHIPGRTNPSLWAVQSVEINGRAAIEWYEIDAVTNALLQNGEISDPSLAFNYPSIAVNDFGDVVIGFSGGDPSTYISTFVVVGRTQAGVTTLLAPQLTKAGVSDYQRLDSNNRNRWGDYSATVVDPGDEKRFWTMQEFVSSTDIWSIQFTEIILPPDLCFIESNGDNVTDYFSPDASALQTAVNAATPGDTLKVAGECAGVQVQGGITQTVRIDRDLTVQGGYLANSWTVDSDPVNNPTILDGVSSGRVVFVTPGSNVRLDGLNMLNGSAQNFAMTEGAGIYNQGSLTISNSVLENNSASGKGGGVYVDSSGDLQLYASILDKNQAGSGGGIFMAGASSLKMDYSAISNNISAADGAGIFVDSGAVEIAASLLKENKATANGGAVYNHGATVVITNTTVATNTAALGGGFYANTGLSTLSHVTFMGNGAGSGGGINNNGGSLSMVNAIVAGSISGGDCVNAGTFNDNGYNLVQDGSCITSGTSFSGPPLLASLADNGGLPVNGFPLFTFALLPGSPAFDAIPSGISGCGTSFITDQRDASRPLNGGCDIGAYEHEAMVYLPLILR